MDLVTVPSKEWKVQKVNSSYAFINSGKNLQPNRHAGISVFGFDAICYYLPFVCLFVVYWIEKQSNRGHALEHLESSGTKIKIVMFCVPVMRMKLNGSLKINYMFFSTLFNVVFLLPASVLHNLSEGFKAWCTT